jgi:hypothetical protein
MEGYTLEYLFMLISAGFSFVLFSLSFLRLRGYITLSAGCRVHFHYKRKVEVGRTTAGTYTVTDDESHLTTAAKQMLWYPIAYTLLVLPICATPLSTSSDPSVLFLVTTSTAGLFVLSGFVNAVLFYKTHNTLPGSSKQNFGTGTTLYGGRSDVSPPSRANVSRRISRSGARPTSVALSIIVEKDVEIKYDEAGPSALPLKLVSLPLPTLPAQALGGRQRGDTYSHHARQLSFPPPRDTRKRTRVEGGTDDLFSDLSTGVYPEKRTNAIEWKVPQHPVRASRRREGEMWGPASGLEALDSVYPFSMAPPVNTKTQRRGSFSILTPKTAADQYQLSRPDGDPDGDFGGNGGSMHRTTYGQRPRRSQYMGVYPSVIDDHLYSATELKHPGH